MTATRTTTGRTGSSPSRGARRPFTRAERELLASLARQTGISLENVELHEQVKRQAVTDELTGLSNRRRFQQTIAAEAAAARRFDQPLGLVMLDIDDFKRVNDTYGHQQGDLVLREVARRAARLLARGRRAGPLRRRGAAPSRSSRRTSPAPRRPPSGSAPRSRRLELPRLDGGGTLRVTVSCGVAASADGDPLALVAAADAALYAAKRDRQEPHRLRGRAAGSPGARGRRSRLTARLHAPAVSRRPVSIARSWVCWTTRSASIWTSSAAAVPTPRRSPGWSRRRSAPSAGSRCRPRIRSRARAGARARSPPRRPPRWRRSPSEHDAHVTSTPDDHAPEPHERRAAGAARARALSRTSPTSRARTMRAEEPHALPPAGRADDPPHGDRRSTSRRPSTASRTITTTTTRTSRPGRDEDVLEETPDFLQETPEHDRLWFEQRPPRDFDFDG